MSVDKEWIRAGEEVRISFLISGATHVFTERLVRRGEKAGSLSLNHSSANLDVNKQYVYEVVEKPKETTTYVVRVSSPSTTETIQQSTSVNVQGFGVARLKVSPSGDIPWGASLKLEGVLSDADGYSIRYNATEPGKSWGQHGNTWPLEKQSIPGGQIRSISEQIKVTPKHFPGPGRLYMDAYKGASADSASNIHSHKVSGLFRPHQKVRVEIPLKITIEDVPAKRFPVRVSYQCYALNGLEVKRDGHRDFVFRGHLGEYQHSFNITANGSTTKSLILEGFAWDIHSGVRCNLDGIIQGTNDNNRRFFKAGDIAARNLMGGSTAGWINPIRDIGSHAVYLSQFNPRNGNQLLTMKGKAANIHIKGVWTCAAGVVCVGKAPDEIL